MSNTNKCCIVYKSKDQCKMPHNKNYRAGIIILYVNDDQRLDI